VKANVLEDSARRWLRTRDAPEDDGQNRPEGIGCGYGRGARSAGIAGVDFAALQGRTRGLRSGVSGARKTVRSSQFTVRSEQRREQDLGPGLGMGTSSRERMAEVLRTVPDSSRAVMTWTLKLRPWGETRTTTMAIGAGKMAGEAVGGEGLRGDAGGEDGAFAG